VWAEETGEANALPPLHALALPKSDRDPLRAMNPTLYTEYRSPIGTLLLTQRGGALTGLWIRGEKHAPAVDSRWQRDDIAFAEVRRQLDEYFSGQRWTFTLDLAPEGTAFQQRVWAALREIPVAATISYGELARRIGQPAAVRAVGLANGRNPLSIVVPCHRVIGANGTLTGYGGGLAAKAWLLEHEKWRGLAVREDERSEVAA
jgi:methylated-DNA-[protein]-cysteine S-methyltransferase